MAADSILRRKVQAARGPEMPGVTGARAWRVAFARAARESIGLDMAVPVLRDDRRSLAELLDLVPDKALLALLEGPGDSLGLLAMSPELLAAVIEMQTIGRVNATPPQPRRPTRTDAAMSARLIDMALCGLETALATAPDLTWAGGFRYASFLDEPRPLGLLLEDLPYRTLVSDLDIAGGQRQGRLLLALPAEGRGPKPAPPPAGADPVAQAAWTDALSGAVMGAEVTLNAVLGRLRLPLHQALALAPGMVLPLPDARTDDVALLGPGGMALVKARLGQHRGARAVKLQATASAMHNPPPALAEVSPASSAQAGAHIALPTVPDTPPLARSA